MGWVSEESHGRSESSSCGVGPAASISRSATHGARHLCSPLLPLGGDEACAGAPLVISPTAFTTNCPPIHASKAGRPLAWVAEVTGLVSSQPRTRHPQRPCRRELA